MIISERLNDRTRGNDGSHVIHTHRAHCAADAALFPALLSCSHYVFSNGMLWPSEIKIKTQNISVVLPEIKLVLSDQNPHFTMGVCGCGTYWLLGLRSALEEVQLEVDGYPVQKETAHWFGWAQSFYHCLHPLLHPDWCAMSSIQPFIALCGFIIIFIIFTDSSLKMLCLVKVKSPQCDSVNTLMSSPHE